MMSLNADLKVCNTSFDEMSSDEMPFDEMSGTRSVLSGKTDQFLASDASLSRDQEK